MVGHPAGDGELPVGVELTPSPVGTDDQNCLDLIRLMQGEQEVKGDGEFLLEW